MTLVSRAARPKVDAAVVVVALPRLAARLPVALLPLRADCFESGARLARTTLLVRFLPPPAAAAAVAAVDVVDAAALRPGFSVAAFGSGLRDAGGDDAEWLDDEASDELRVVLPDDDGVRDDE